MGPDFSTIDSVQRAEELRARGELERMFLMPLEFGGQDVPPNVVYVPVGMASAKARIDNDVVRPLAAEGKVRRYTARPEYEGDSVVPVAVEVAAWDPAAEDRGKFTAVINMWGSALERDRTP